MITGTQYADQAMSDRYTGTPYSKLDCQAFVEQVLKDCGVRKPDGSPYNWKGCNSMWRNALEWKGTIQQCLDRYGMIPPGAWVFIVTNDGGEKERGYYDDQGNAKHIGIYCDPNRPDPVRDSTKTKTRDGVGYRKLSGFTHVGLPKMILYNKEETDSEILSAVHTVRNENSSDEDYL